MDSRINETTLLSYCVNGYLSVEQRLKYLESIGVGRIYKGEFFVSPSATVQDLNKKTDYEKVNSLIDYLLKKHIASKKRTSIDMSEIDSKVNKLDREEVTRLKDKIDENTITADEIPL